MKHYDRPFSRIPNGVVYKFSTRNHDAQSGFCGAEAATIVCSATMSKLYIERHIRLGEEVVTEAELLQRSRLIIVLAEPGAGKTELLAHIAGLLGTESVRAARFRTDAYAPLSRSIVIDAMDEVARTSESQLNDIVAKASRHAAETVVFASRSGEWEKARTKFVEECFGFEPDVARLEALNADEQKRLFEVRFRGERFDQFTQEADRFDLSPLLGNPEFLQLFGLAYLENNRSFSSKVQIYSDAARRLAQESNDARSARGRPDAAALVSQAGAVFARLLLSGASGISLKEKIDDRNYPYAGIVTTGVNGNLNHLLDSRLFKPASDANEHEPVHRIVAEYLAARYLAARIADQGDRLSVKRCLAIIAPNGVVRDELRGLLGWLTALGGPGVQKAAIDIDPYAVLSNGDPAQLLPENKLRLIERLQTYAEIDPYFRRSDEWRSFNVGHFFSNETIEALRPVLSGRADTHLRGLILELIQGTSAVENLRPDLQTLILDPFANGYERIRASRLLLSVRDFDPISLFDPLLSEASTTAMQILTEVINNRGTSNLGFETVIGLLRILTNLYPDSGRDRNGASRYFLKEFFRKLPLGVIANYLDELTSGIRCTCNPKKAYACECRHGISKIVGSLLDRYFDGEPGPHDPERVWNWTKNLYYDRRINSENSASVRALSEDHTLRQAIHRVAFSAGCTPEELNEIETKFYFGHTHSGLLFHQQDIGVLSKHAFEQGRVALWETLWRPHDTHREKQGPDDLRASMRAQAREDSKFLEVWARRDRAAKSWWRENRRDWASRSKRHERRTAGAKARTFKHLEENRTRIEAGRHGWWLQRFAYNYLYEPDRFEKSVGEFETAKRALRNCFDFLTPHVPSLDELARREGAGVATVLHAGCVVLWRENGSLEGVPLNVLRAVKTESSSSKGIADDEAKDFDEEINRQLFQNEADIENFIRAYVEPTLSAADEAPTNVGWLEYKSPFQPLKTSLPLEWLRRFPDMPQYAEASLFKLAAQYAPKMELRALIAERVERHLPVPATDASQSLRNRRTFWLLNSFFHDDDERVWEALKADKNILLAIAGRSDRFSNDDEWESPPLSAAKLYDVLDAFVGEWPAVDLPSGYGTGDPPEETAYRYMREIPWRIGRDDPLKALPILDRLLSDDRFADYHNDVRAVRASASRKAAHDGYRPPAPAEISAMLEKRSVASVEDMRALMVEALSEIENQIRQAETDTLDTFYTNGSHVDENTARNRIVEHLRGYMTAHRLSVVIEHQMAQQNRCDITVTEMIEGRRRLLTIEVKGQWHPELFTAAAQQLNARYASNPDAYQQGIYLVLWFGPSVEVAALKNTRFDTAADLRTAIVEQMPVELRGRIDVQTIDLSRTITSTTSGKSSKGRARKKRPANGDLTDAESTAAG